MATQIKKIGKSQIDLSVSLDGGELEKYINKTLDMFGQELEIEGFRKGKAPRDQVRKNIGDGGILQAALELAINKSLADIIMENKWDVLNTEKLEVKENSADRLVYKIIINLFPDIEIPDLTKFQVKRKEVSVNEEEVARTLKEIVSSRAKLSAKSGALENGDRAEIDFEVLSEGKVIEGGISANHPTVIGGKNFIPGFEENLVGMKIGEERAFSLKAPGDYFNKEIAGKDLDFKVKLNSIMKLELPKIDDEFARSLGKFTDLANLRASIQDSILQEKNMRERQRARLEVLDNIIKESKVDVPESIIQEQIESMMKNFDRDLHANNLEMSLYLAHIGKTQDDLKRDWRKEAERQVKISLAIHKITKLNNIKVPDKEIDEAVTEAAQAIIIRGDADKNSIDIQTLKEAVSNKLANDKVMELLERTCII